MNCSSQVNFASREQSSRPWQYALYVYVCIFFPDGPPLRFDARRGCKSSAEVVGNASVSTCRTWFDYWDTVKYTECSHWCNDADLCNNWVLPEPKWIILNFDAVLNLRHEKSWQNSNENPNFTYSKFDTNIIEIFLITPYYNNYDLLNTRITKTWVFSFSSNENYLFQNSIVTNRK